MRRLAPRLISSVARLGGPSRTHQSTSASPYASLDAVHELVGDPRQEGPVPGSVGIKAISSCGLLTGQVVFRERGGAYARTPSMHSVQVSERAHVRLRGEGRFLAHSFDAPNLTLRLYDDVDGGGGEPQPDGRLPRVAIDFVALRPIEAGETLSFNYCANEWALAAPFADSSAGPEGGAAEAPAQVVAGFASLEERARLALLEQGLLPPHLLRMWLRSLHGLNPYGDDDEGERDEGDEE